MALDLYLTLLVSLAILFLGIVVYLRDRRNISGILFFLFSLANALFLVVNYVSLTFVATASPTTLFWMRAVIFLAVWQALSFFLFVNNFPSTTLRIHKFYLLVLIGLGGIISTLILFTPLIFSRVVFEDGKASPVPGPLIPLFAFYAVGLVLASLVLGVRKYLKAKGLEKTQWLFAGLGAASTLILLAIFNFILAIFFGETSFIQFTPLFLLPMVGLTTYAIIKHRFMDIRATVNKLIGYTLMSAFVYLVFYALVVLYDKFLGGLYSPAALLLGVLIAPLFTLVYIPVRRFLGEREFLPLLYDSKEVMFELGEKMSHELELKKLLDAVLGKLCARLGVGKAAVVVLDGSGKEGKGGVVKTIRSFGEADQSLLASFTAVPSLVIVREELYGGNGPLLSFLEKTGMYLLLPLISSGKRLGYLVLGQKLSEEPYTVQDIDFLASFTQSLSVAVERAALYQEVKDFNFTLQKEIGKATRKLTKAYDELKTLDAMKDDFISITSHELRTPMTSVKGYLWMLRQGKGGSLSEKQLEYLSRAERGADRMIRLINDMLDVSRIEQGKLVLKTEEFDPLPLVREVIEDLRLKAANKNLALDYVGDAASLPAVRADRQRLREVLTNLIDNAIKYTDQGSVHIDAYPKGDFLTVNINDTGKGIAKEDLPRLFRKFGRLETSFVTAAEASGTGLGLFITKALVERMGGKVTVKSEMGAGSTFSFNLPLVVIQ